MLLVFEYQSRIGSAIGLLLIWVFGLELHLVWMQGYQKLLGQFLQKKDQFIFPREEILIGGNHPFLIGPGA